MAEHIRDRMTAALAGDGPSMGERLLFEMLLFIEEQQYAFFADARKHFHDLAHTGTRIMSALDDLNQKISDQFTQQAADLQELLNGVAGLKAQIAAGNDQGSLDEANKIETGLQAATDAMRAAAAQFDVAPPAPTPAPDAAKRHPRG